MLEPAKVDVGFGAKAAIRAVNSVSNQTNNKIVKEFKVECRVNDSDDKEVIP